MRLTVLLAATLLAVASPIAAHAQKSADTLRISWRDAVPNVDPYYNTQRNGLVLADLAWDNLLYRDPRTNQLVPALATSWTQPDPTTLEFTLRDGVTFQNGDAFSAEDVAYTVNTLLTDRKVATPSNYSWLAGAEVIDRLHVQLKLKRVYPPAINVVAAVLPIWPKAYRERVGDEAYAQAPIGTGPYRLSIAGGDLALERYDGYYAGSPKGRPAIRRIVIHQVADSSTEMAELLGGRADWISDFPADQFDAVSRMPRLRAIRSEIQRTTYLNMDAAGRSGADGPLTREKVRQAIAHAIDRQTMAKQLMQGSSSVLDIACFPNEFGCDPSAAVHYDYDPARAKQLLAEAGYPNGVDIDLYTYLPANWGGAVQNYLRDVGINLRLRQMQVGAVIQLAQQGKTPMTLAGWGGFAVNDVSAILQYFYTGGVFDMTRDPEIAALAAEGAQTTDPEKRRMIYARAFHLISAHAYFLPLFTYSKTFAFSSDLDFTPWYDDNPRFYRSRWR